VGRGTKSSPRGDEHELKGEPLKYKKMGRPRERKDVFTGLQVCGMDAYRNPRKKGPWGKMEQQKGAFANACSA